MLTDAACGVYYDNIKCGDPLKACGNGFLHRELAEMAFLALFARDVSASLNSRDVVLTAAQLLYNYFHYDLAVFPLPAESGGVTTFSPHDPVCCLRAFLMARESFPDLKLREINCYRLMGLATPRQAKVPSYYPAVVEITGDGMKVTLYCSEDSEKKANYDFLTGIADCLTTALRNAHEHDRVKELSVRDSHTGLYNRSVHEEYWGSMKARGLPRHWQCLY